VTSPGRKPLVVVYLVDGARPDVMEELLASGDLPNIRREIVEPGTARTASSCFPSTTGPAYLPFLMGCFPGTMNVPGIRWLDKAEFHSKRWGKDRFRSYNGIEAPWFNSDLPREQREVLLLKEYEGLKFREIADVLGVAESTVKSRMYAGLDAMRMSLASLGIP